MWFRRKLLCRRMCCLCCCFENQLQKNTSITVSLPVVLISLLLMQTLCLLHCISAPHYDRQQSCFGDRGDYKLTEMTMQEAEAWIKLQKKTLFYLSHLFYKQDGCCRQVHSGAYSSSWFTWALRCWAGKVCQSGSSWDTVCAYTCIRPRWHVFL